jgi:hypothetical protein
MLRISLFGPPNRRIQPGTLCAIIFQTNAPHPCGARRKFRENNGNFCKYLLTKYYLWPKFGNTRSKMKMKTKSLIYMVFLFMFLNSCDLSKDNLVIRMDKKTFDKEYSAWELQDLKSYQFTYDFFNDAGPVGPMKITIRENEAVVIENMGQDDDLGIAKNIPEIYDFINETFDFIESVKNGTYNGNKIVLLVLDITYNTQYHYPKKVNFSEGYVDNALGGGYYTLEISEFIQLNE